MPAATLSKQAHVEGGATTRQALRAARGRSVSPGCEGPSPHLHTFSLRGPRGRSSDKQGVLMGGWRVKEGQLEKPGGPCPELLPVVKAHTCPRALAEEGLASRCCVPRVTPAEGPCRLRSLRGMPSARWLMRHWSQGLVCTGATVKSHLPCAALSPFIPRIELCQGLASGLRAIHAVSRGQARWALPQSPPHRAGRVGCGRGAGPHSGWAVPRHTPSRPGVSGTVASTPPVGRPRSCRTAVLGGAPTPGQPAATRPSTERPWSPSCRAWAPAILRVTSMPRVQPSAEGAALALGLDLENQQEFLRAAQGTDGRELPAAAAHCLRSKQDVL